jgi:hypothetical protein
VSEGRAQELTTLVRDILVDYANDPLRVIVKESGQVVVATRESF